MFTTFRPELSLLLLAPVLAFGQGSQLPKYTVATLPNASTQPSYTVQVIDGANAQDCVTGGGASNVLCEARTGTWAPVAPFQSLTTTGTSGPATLNLGVLNVPTIANVGTDFKYTVAPPAGGAYQVVYPTGVTLVTTHQPPDTADATSAAFYSPDCPGAGCTAYNATATYTFTLPSNITPANVTAVYGDAWWSTDKVTFAAGGVDFTIQCGVSPSFQLVAHFSSASAHNEPLNETSHIISSVTGATFNSMTCVVTSTVSGGVAIEGMNSFMNTLRVLVYDSVDALTADDGIFVESPLSWNPSLTALGLDPNYLTAGSGVTLTPNFDGWTISSTGGGGAVDSVANSDGTLTVSPTTGPVVASLALAHANTWTAKQTQPAPLLSNVTGSTQCLHVDTTGQVSGTGSDCGAGGGGGLSGQTTNYLPKATSATASTTGSIIEDTGTSIIVHGTGTAAVVLPQGTTPSGVASSAMVTTNTSAQLLGSENGGTAARICTATNGVCVTGSRQWACEPGLGDGLNAITAGTYLQTTCYNTNGSTVTLTGLSCFTDNAGSSTMNASGHTLGALLTGAVTCSASFAAGTQSANVALTSGDYIAFTFVSDGTSKQSTWVVKGTY